MILARRWVGLLIACVFFDSTAYAAVLELSQVVQQGLAFSPEVKKAEAQLSEAQSTTTQRKGLLAPKIDLYGSARLKEDPSRSSTSTSTFVGNDEEYDASVRLVQPLYRGGLLFNGIESYKLSEEIERQRLFDAKQAAVTQLVFAYYDLAQSEKELVAAEEQLEVLKIYADIVRRYEQNGRSRRMDRLQSEVNLSLTTADQVRLLRQRNVSSDMLKKLLGLGTGGEPLSGKMPTLPTAVPPPAFGLAYETMLKNNPEMKVAELTRQKTDFDNAIERAEDRPTLNIEGSYGYRAAERPDWFADNSNYYTIGLFLTVPLFSGFTSLAKRRVHAERLTQDERTIEVVRLDLRQRLQQSLLAQKSEYERLTTAQTAAKLGREALLLANNSFRQGVASNQDVLNAQRTRYDSERLLIESQFSYLRARLDVQRLLGTSLQQVYAN
ncbi:MAG: TolC family protein [Bdellovibrionales bacterium]